MAFRALAFWDTLFVEKYKFALGFTAVILMDIQIQHEAFKPAQLLYAKCLREYESTQTPTLNKA